MSAATDEGEQACARCGTQVAPRDAFLSGDGPVCEGCHKQEKAADKQREGVREANASALFGGVLSTAAGAGLLGTALFGDAILIRFHLICVFIVVIACARVPRLAVNRLHGRAGKVIALVGGAMGAVGVVLLVVRFAS